MRLLRCPSTMLVSSVQITFFQSSKVQSLCRRAKASWSAFIASDSSGFHVGLTLCIAARRSNRQMVLCDRPNSYPNASVVISLPYWLACTRSSIAWVCLGPAISGRPAREPSSNHASSNAWFSPELYLLSFAQVLMARWCFCSGR